MAIDDGGQRRDLERAGADFVLDDLSELDLGAVRSDPPRGAMPEHASDGVHYPGTYLAGVYNRVASRAGDRDRTVEELVNVPNWLPFDIAAGDGGWWSEGVSRSGTSGVSSTSGRVC